MEGYTKLCHDPRVDFGREQQFICHPNVDDPEEIAISDE